MQCSACTSKRVEVDFNSRDVFLVELDGYNIWEPIVNLSGHHQINGIFRRRRYVGFFRRQSKLPASERCE